VDIFKCLIIILKFRECKGMKNDCFKITIKPTDQAIFKTFQIRV